MLNPFFIKNQHSYQLGFLNQSNYSFLLNPSDLFTYQQALQREFSNALLYQNHLQYQIQESSHYLSERTQDLYYVYNVKPAFSFKSEREAFTQCTSLLSEAASVENSVCEVKESELYFQESNVKVEETTKGTLRAQIAEMLNFFLSEFGKVNKEEMDKYREKYSYNQSLVEVFDALRTKYTLATKCREDMVRFILRKAITFLRDDIRDKQGINAKSASLVLCKRYFDVKFDEELMKQANIKNEGDLLGFLLPYKKNSRNRTANSRFIKEIFGSKAFYQDYQIYLSNLEEILESENRKKIDKFINFLVNCVQTNSIHTIKEFRRLPWSQVWIQSTKDIAFSLADTLKPSHTKSRIKDTKKLRQYH